MYWNFQKNSLKSRETLIQFSGKIYWKLGENLLKFIGIFTRNFVKNSLIFWEKFIELLRKVYWNFWENL